MNFIRPSIDSGNGYSSVGVLETLKPEPQSAALSNDERASPLKSLFHPIVQMILCIACPQKCLLAQLVIWTPPKCLRNRFIAVFHLCCLTFTTMTPFSSESEIKEGCIKKSSKEKFCVGPSTKEWQCFELSCNSS